MGRAVAVALAGAALALAGCGSNADDSTQPSTSVPETTGAVARTGVTTTVPGFTSEPAPADPLVDAAWLTDPTNDHVLVDVRSPDAYAEGHLEGAVNLPSNRLDDPDAPIGSQLNSAQHVAAELGAAGIEPSDVVVLYDGTSSLYAARVYFAMRLYGHQELRLLDGGTIASDADGGVLSTTPTPVTPTDYPVNDATGALRYELDEVTDHLADGGTFTDARAAAEYVGDTRFGDEAGGHIPGAVNLEWERTVGPDGRFLDTEQLSDVYADAGVGPDDPVVTYCYIGVRAAHTWFVLSELLGYPDVALYDGSWSEYGTTPGLEVET